MSEPVLYLPQAFDDGLAALITDGKTENIYYYAAKGGALLYKAKWANPEEKVRAELWAALIYQYEYPATRLRIEFAIPDRLASKRADLVIFRDDDHKKPYFVLETKAADASDSALLQALEQACGYRAALSAAFAGAVSGSTTHRLLRFDDDKLFSPLERDRNKIADIPTGYGDPPKWRFYREDDRHDLRAVSREALRSAIRKCHQTLWGGGKRSPIVAFGEFCKLVFVKHRDEKAARPAGEPYAFQVGSGEADADLAKRIHKLYDKERADEPDVFTDQIRVEDGPLARVVEHLESISLSRTDLDTKGVAFEEFMSGFFKGDFGQYFTPREPIAFAVALLDPKHTDLTLDPACGSGGFLLYALDHVRREADKLFPNHKTSLVQHTKHFNYWHDYAEKKLFGLEINEELARVAKMNMIIHDDGHTNVVGNDALDFLDRLTAKNAGLAPNAFDLVLTNPPFGAVVKRADKAENYIEQFELRHYLSKNAAGAYGGDPADVNDDDPAGKRGAKSLKERASIKTEILFLERLHTFLKPGTGRAAVVLPDGILTNSSLQGVRDWLLLHFQVLAVVSLPQFAFAHYDAGVKTSIVFLRKLRPGETVAAKEPLFMALAENIGYDATGRPTYVVSVESETAETAKVEQHACDLFTYRVYYHWDDLDPKNTGWTETHREIIPDTGLVGQYRSFQRNPAPFFV
ncbi:type I restriction enzyme M protein [Hymenobacter sp. UYAg731]